MSAKIKALREELAKGLQEVARQRLDHEIEMGERLLEVAKQSAHITQSARAQLRSQRDDGTRQHALQELTAACAAEDAAWAALSAHLDGLPASE